MAEMSQQELDLEVVRRKKFRASELPISASQRAAVDNLLYLFKKKGGFDLARKQIWAGFNGSVRIIPLTLDFLETDWYGQAGSQRHIYIIFERNGRIGN